MECSLPGSSVHGTSQAKILEWAATSFSRDATDLKRQADHLSVQNLCISKSYDLPSHVWLRIYLDYFYKEAKKESFFRFQFWE